MQNINVEEGSGDFEITLSTFSVTSTTSRITYLSTATSITKSTSTKFTSTKSTLITQNQTQTQTTSIYSTLSSVTPLTSKLKTSTLYQLTTTSVNNSCNENIQCINRYGPSVCINNICSCIPPTIFFNQSCISNNFSIILVKFSK